MRPPRVTTELYCLLLLSPKWLPSLWASTKPNQRPAQPCSNSTPPHYKPTIMCIRIPTPSHHIFKPTQPSSNSTHPYSNQTNHLPIQPTHIPTQFVKWWSLHITSVIYCLLLPSPSIWHLCNSPVCPTNLPHPFNLQTQPHASHHSSFTPLLHTPSLFTSLLHPTLITLHPS